MAAIKVLCSGGFRAALLALVPALEAATGLRSGIGLAVRACKPEVGTLEALTRALLACRSIAISTSASGIYSISTNSLARH